MRFITVSELKQKATQVVREIEETKEEVIITKAGKPVAIMVHITEEAFSLKEKGHGEGKEGKKRDLQAR